ncbi:hypothetical protein [Burkholderia stagnalis]|uniref:hypothetical protein n=1 Tax=Burkholderia stagnalis TaxID=1503054 RepID=UPI000F574ED6|nr:hypothetical protein [Burkholderia stagnalis]
MARLLAMEGRSTCMTMHWISGVVRAMSAGCCDMVAGQLHLRCVIEQLADSPRVFRQGTAIEVPRDWRCNRRQEKRTCVLSDLISNGQFFRIDCIALGPARVIGYTVAVARLDLNAAIHIDKSDLTYIFRKFRSQSRGQPMWAARLPRMVHAGSFASERGIA